jgi:hypothetical protein
VVACDLQTAFLQNLNRPNLDVWRHDIVTFPERRFDLVHALDPALAAGPPSPR